MLPGFFAFTPSGNARKLARMNATNWQNRIVGHGTESPEQLLANEANWRVHPRSQQQALEGVLDEVGYVQSVIVNNRTSEAWEIGKRNVPTMVDGHMRVETALSKGQTEIPVVYVDLEPSEEAKILATFDPISALATTDKEKLDELLREVETGSAGVAEMLSSLAEDAGLYFGEEPKEIEDPGAQVDKAAELLAKWKVERGQIWRIGNHRLMCGDSTDAGDVEALMDGGTCEVLLTDPPYGMNVDTDYSKMPRGAKKYDRVIGDEEHWDMAPVLELWKSPKMAIWGGGWFYESLPTGGSWIIWDKQPYHTVAGPQNHFEECWIYPHKKRIIIRKLWTGYTAKEKHEDRLHPTQKPVDVIEEVVAFLGDWTTCCEPFTGSGTTLVAAERQGRRCYGMEIEPKYVAVTLQRLADMGLEPELAESA